MSDAPPSPHDAYDRYIRRMDRLGAWFAILGALIFGIVALALTAVLAALLVSGIIDLSEPRVWGTFRETSCEQTGRHGCRSIGTWVSDDGAVVKHAVYLDGLPDAGGNARASFQPTGILNDSDTNIVHVPALTGASVWLPGVMLPLWIGYVLFRARVRHLLLAAPRSEDVAAAGGLASRFTCAPPTGREGVRGSPRAFAPPWRTTT